MGSRANFVILDRGGIELYYDHWGAQCISHDLLLDGEQATVGRVRSMHRLNAEVANEWLDDTWAEGALVLDLSLRRLCWFESEGLPPRITSTLLEQTWDGWMAAWVPVGMRGILRFLGLDPIPVLGQPVKGESRDEAGIGLLSPHWVCSAKINGVVEEKQGISNDSLMSVRFADGTVWTTALGVWLGVVAELPWEWVIEFVRQAQADGRAGAGPGGAWATDTERHEESNWALEGFYVDVPNRRFSWWSKVHETHHFDSFRRNWPGFTIIELGDNYEWQERSAGISGIQPPVVDALRWARNDLVRAIERGRQEANPAASAAAKLAEQGVKVELSPWTEVHVPAARRIAGKRVLAEIDRLIDADVKQLSPVRFLNTKGDLIEPCDGEQ